MIWWSVELGLKDSTWVDIANIGRNNCMTKKELKKFLSEFTVNDWPQYDIISVKIMRSRRIGTTRMYRTETMGYTDVLSCGTLAYIEL